jgi:hypothetical protein
MQNARSTAAISRESEGYHFSHDALVTCKLPITAQFLSYQQSAKFSRKSFIGRYSLNLILIISFRNISLDLDQIILLPVHCYIARTNGIPANLDRGMFNIAVFIDLKISL